MLTFDIEFRKQIIELMIISIDDMFVGDLIVLYWSMNWNWIVNFFLETTRARRPPAKSQNCYLVVLFFSDDKILFVGIYWRNQNKDTK